MIRFPQLKNKERKRDTLDDRAPEQDEAPLTPEQARRELGWDLLPINGGDSRED